MDHSKALQAQIQQHLPWHRARTTFIAKFILALILVRTVNHSILASVLNGRVEVASNAKRIHRFFKDFAFPTEVFTRLILALLPQKEDFVLTLDRTDWKLGEKPINILMLGIAYKGIAFPVIWMVLPKAGISNTGERIALLQRFFTLVDPSFVLAIVADREFIGHDWFRYLKSKKVLFVMRIKKNALIGSKGRTRPAWAVFANAEHRHATVLPKRCWVYGVRLFLVATRQDDGELVIVACTAKPELALAYYSCRWECETLFASLKTRGFNLEDSHLTDGDRLEKLVALLALAFTWAHLVGEWVHERSPIRLKNHGYRAKSIFRVGLEVLRSAIVYPYAKGAKYDFTSCLNVLSGS